jgi:Head domain of trimeric autotransporter adhesin
MKYIFLLAIFFLFLVPLYSQVGKVGINTTAPAAMLHVKDSSVLFTGATVLPITPGNTPVSGAGIRMMWYADKAAFRAGHVTGDDWDVTKIGVSSFAVGYNTEAMGNYSSSMGFNSKASGEVSTAIGYFSTASGIYSTAIGYNSRAINNYSTAIGYATIASGRYAIAMGNNTTALEDYSTATGYFTRASGENSTAMGFSTTARAYNSFAIGQFNDSVTASSQTSWVATDPLFTIGNGSSNVARSNAVTVLKNGNTGIGVLNPTQKLEVNGKIVTTNFQITDGGGIGKVLQSDATGTASWINSTALNITETDPKVISSTVNSIPRWNGSALQNGVILDNGLNIGIGGVPLSTNKVTVVGKTSTTDFQMTNGAGTNKLLESSSNGTANWTDDVVLDSINSRIIESDISKSLITMADAFNYNSAVERILVLPASAFQLMPVNGVSTAGLTSTTISGGQTITTGTAGVDAWFEAPVYLPDFARVKEIILHVRDASSTYEVDAEFRSITTFTSTVEASISGTGTTATAGDISISRTGLDEVIRNTKAYFLRFNCKEFNGNLRLYRAQINYTVSRAD